MNTARPKGFNAAIIAGLLGTTLEYYDLVLVGTLAATAFPPIFYPELNPVLALGLSITAYGVTFVSRPVGGVLFGYLGDKRGRKFSFIWTMIITSIAVLAVSIMPGYSVIGYLGISLILLFRVVQGVGLGGEFGTAAVFVSEFSQNSKWRAFWSHWVSNGVMIGGLLSMVANVIATNLLSTTQYLAWGWRLLFGIGVLMGLLAIIIRYKVGESELFKNLEVKREVSKSPIKEVVKTQWRTCIRLTLMVLPPLAGFSMMTLPFGVSYLRALGADANFANIAWVGGAFLTVLSMVVSGILADRLGRRQAYLIGAVIATIAILTFFPLLQTRNFVVAILAIWSVLGSCMFTLATWPAFASESFPTKLRSTGTSIGYQFGSLIAGLIISFYIPYAITAAAGVLNAWPWVAGISFIILVIAIILCVKTKETKDVRLNEL